MSLLLLAGLLCAEAGGSNSIGGGNNSDNGTSHSKLSAARWRLPDSAVRNCEPCGGAKEVSAGRNRNRNRRKRKHQAGEFQQSYPRR